MPPSDPADATGTAAPAPRRRRLAATLAVGAWAVLVSAGTLAVARYHATPGVPATGAPETWPAASTLPAPGGRPALLLFLHPRCPCSTASVASLERVLASAPAPLPPVRVVAYRPAGAPPAWAEGSLLARAAALPGSSVHGDPGGVEAARFGVATSGTVLAYDATGALRSSGGVTPSRGHEGDSAGAAALVALLRGEGPPRGNFPVYGCSLLDPGASVAGLPGREAAR